MRAIEYHAPSSINEALALLDDNARIIAGGTDIIPQLNAGVWSIDKVVDIKTVAEANVLEFSKEKGLSLGAAVPCHLIYNDKNVIEHYQGLIDSASMIGGIQIQGRASIGGNLCNAVPSADSIPALIALGAICVIAGPNGSRRVAVEKFCTAPRKNVLGTDEILVSLDMPYPNPNSGARYIRFIPRNEMDIAVAGVGVQVVLSDSRDTIVSARIALSAVGPIPLLVETAGAALEGVDVSESSIDKAALLAKDAATPISDMRGTVEHRKQLVYVLTKRALRDAIKRAKGDSLDV